MGRIEITTEPIELVIAETSIFMQADPSASAAWDALMEIEVTYSDPKKRDKAKTDMEKALASMAHTPEDADLLTKLDLGPAMLKKVAMAYVQEVAGFPTVPSSPSAKR